MDANNTPIPKTPSTLRFITTSFLIVEIENFLSRVEAVYP